MRGCSFDLEELVLPPPLRGPESETENTACTRRRPNRVPGKDVTIDHFNGCRAVAAFLRVLGEVNEVAVIAFDGKSQLDACPAGG